MPEFVSLRNHAQIGESWLRDRLVEHPELLGLGDVTVRDAERSQPSGGRLDLLLEDVESRTRYEVELQLGAMDESHIIRAIEYWDIERRRYPQYEHIAVIVAEDVTSRFLNVISLFNGSIPLVAIKLQGVKVAGAFSILATRVVDVIQLGTEDEDVGVPVDASYWESRSSTESFRLMREMLERIKLVEPVVAPRYTRQYIGLEIGGQARNFVVMSPRKSSAILTSFKISQEDDLTARIEDSGLDMMSYERRWGNYRIRLVGTDFQNHAGLIDDLVRKSWDQYFNR